jgi:hypothetical protein
MSSAEGTAGTSIKVRALASPAMVWTAAGSVYVIEEVQAVVNDWAAKTSTNGDLARIDAADFSLIRTRVGANVHRAVKAAYERQLPFGGQAIVPGTTQHPFSSDFLFAGYHDGRPYILEFARDGQMNWHQDRMFYAVGSGGAFATVAQALLQHHLDEGPLDLHLGKQLAYRTIETTCQVSSQFVGGPVQMAVVDAEGARILGLEEMEEIQTAVAGWKQVERDAFRGSGQAKVAGAPDLPPEIDG